MTLIQMRSALLGRKKLFIRVAIGVMLAVLTISLIMPNTYTADTEVVVDSKSMDTVTGAILPAAMQANVVATQVDIISSHAVALRVVERLKLFEQGEYHEKFLSSSTGTWSEKDWIAEYLLKKLDVIPSRDSNVLTIRFPSHSAQLAADIANEFADAYIHASLEISASPARHQAQWYDDQIAALRKRVEEARQRLADFQRKSSILGTPEEHLDVDNAKLTEISTALVAAQQTMYDAQTRLNQMNQALAKDQLEALPDILGNPVLQSLKTDLSRAESSFADVSSRFDRKHPQYLSAEAAVESLRKRFAAELENARSSVVQAAQLSERRVAELQRAQEEQKRHLISLGKEHDSIAVLSRDADDAQAAYDAAIARAGQIKLQGQLDQSNIAVVSPAIPPGKPSRPKPLLYMILAVPLSLLIAFGVVLGLETFDRRLRAAKDLVEYTGLVVLAEIRLLPQPGKAR